MIQEKKKKYIKFPPLECPSVDPSPNTLFLSCRCRQDTGWLTERRSKRIYIFISIYKVSQNLIGHTIGPEEHATCFKSVRTIFLKKCAKEHGKGNTLELTCILMSHVSWGSTSVTFTHNSHTPRTSTARWTNRWVAYFREPAWQ